MLVSSVADSVHRPRVSIILPTYNRAKFLPGAFESIRAQEFADWELIVVDDGSSDETGELVSKLAEQSSQVVRYVYQENQGPAAARNTGLELTRGEFIAFFDSDDFWLPHHLSDCMVALVANPEVDWVYSAGRVIDNDSEKILKNHTFRQGKSAKPFLNLRHVVSGRLRIINDPKAVQCSILYGLYCGMQNSVFRTRVFESLRLPLYSPAEDQLFGVLALKAGYRIGYIDDIHVLRHIHCVSASAASSGSSIDHRIRVVSELIRALEDLPTMVDLDLAEWRALRCRLGKVLFWKLGYTLLWQHGHRAEAMDVFRRAIAVWPWNMFFLKTYAKSFFFYKIIKLHD